MRAALLSSCILLLPMAAAAQAQGFDRDALLSELAVMISSAAARQDTKHPVFRGCIDWHSAVHGHWALLRIARATGRHEDSARWADSSLSPAGLAREAELLRRNPYFEMPYGRAWFLRLAVEHELWARGAGVADPERLRSMAQETAASLLSYFEVYPPDPDSREYANASWALAQLHAWCRHRDSRACLDRVDELVRRRFWDPAGPRFSSDSVAPEFFSAFGNWAALMAWTQDEKALARFLKAHPISDEALAPVERLVPNPHRPAESFTPYAHHLGMNWSRAWALKILSRAVPAEAERWRYEKAFREHVAWGARHHALYASDYWAYGHWVPQFAVYALTEGSGF